MRIYQEEDKLIIAEGKAKVVIEPWGANSLRVRMTAEPKMDENDWALTENMDKVPVEISFETIDVTDPWYKGEEYAKYHQTGTQAKLVNGKITAKVSHEGWISFYNQKGELLTEDMVSFGIILQSVRPPLVRIRQNGMRRVQRSLIISLLPVIHLPKSRCSILLQQEEHR